MLSAAGIRSAHLLRPSLVTRTGPFHAGPATTPLPPRGRLAAAWATLLWFVGWTGGRS